MVRRWLRRVTYLACILLAAVCIIGIRKSERVAVGLERHYPGSAWAVGLLDGHLTCAWWKFPTVSEATWLYPEFKWTRREHADRMPRRWWVGGGTRSHDLHAPLWLIATALVLIPGLWGSWRVYRAARPGHCRCGYSLAGLGEGAACPECGAKP